VSISDTKKENSKGGKTMSELYRNRQEELDYVKQVITEKRPICSWCEHRPGNKKADMCGRGLDWYDTVAMDRKACVSFELAQSKINKDITRTADADIPLITQLQPRPQQLEFNF
jgi:hypothetical protein